MQIYITDKTGQKFFNTNVAAGYASGERNNMTRRLRLVRAEMAGHTFIDSATAHIVEEREPDEMTDDELLAALTE